MRAPALRMSAIELFVARTIQHHDHQVFDVAVVAAGDGAQVIFHRGVQINRAFRRRPDDNFFHVEIGRVQQAAMFAGGKHDDGAGFARRAKIGTFERVHGDVHFGVLAAFVAHGRAHFFADEEHGRFVALAFADDDGAVHAHAIHFPAHGFDGGSVRALRGLPGPWCAPKRWPHFQLCAGIRG